MVWKGADYYAEGDLDVGGMASTATPKSNVESMSAEDLKKALRIEFSVDTVDAHIQSHGS